MVAKVYSVTALCPSSGLRVGKPKAQSERTNAAGSADRWNSLTVKGTFDAQRSFAQDVGVQHCGFHVRVTQQLLHSTNIATGLE